MIGTKQKEIDSLGKWYQSIDFGKYGKSKGSATDLDKKWKLIKEELPFSLKDKRVLDLGCNAGYFMLKAAKEGTKEILGIEENKDFYQQCLLTLNIFGILEPCIQHTMFYLTNFDSKQISLNGTYDITFAFNFFYWLTYSDEVGSIKQPEEVFLRFLRHLSFHTQYLLIIGAEGVGRARAKKNANDLGTSLDRTLPFLSPYFHIIKKKIVRQNKKRLSNIILCKSKEH